MRTILLLGLALAVGLVVISGTCLGADLVMEKSPSLLKSPLDVSIGKKLSTAEPVEAEKEQEKNYRLIGNLEDVKGVVTTDAGEQQTSFGGEIAFMAVPGDRGDLTLVLTGLNLVSSGVATKEGNSGVIGLDLVEPEYKASYDSRKGRFSTEFQSTLHYALIDEIKGFIPSKSEEGDQFFSYTESMAGKIEGSLPEGMKAADEGEVTMNAEIHLELERSVVGSLRDMVVYLDLTKLWWYLETSPTEILLVQPVFIGTGPSDPSATGTVYNTLLDGSAEIWDRCGTVRCIAIRSRTPVYINNNAYRVLNSEAEAAALRAEVDVTDSVEVFVVERWDPYFDGGGACWSSGTASAKIVTCDQQMAVPCPMPVGLWGCSAGEGGTCGDVNYYHLAHELGHAVNLLHPGDYRPGMVAGSSTSIMEPSGFCRDNPDVQSARNCRSASSPLLYSGRSSCTGSPDIMD
ncbi:MAG TPA: hypothetical protein HA349_08655 [Methanotrichaceae archaeon]|nr:hypothetical protein [Methanotrichaceae archaeon]